MSTLQKLRLAVAVFASISMAPSSHAQMTVIVAKDAPASFNQAQTMTQWANQYQQMVQQLMHLKNQYAAVTGTRNLGQIFNNPALRGHLPNEWASIYDEVRKGNLQGLSGKASSIFTAEGFDPNATGGRRRQLDVLAANKAMSMQAYDATLARLQNINALMQQADATQDVKAAADLQNRMTAENAMIQNEQVRLSLAFELQRAEERLALEQRAREFDSVFTRRQ